MGSLADGVLAGGGEVIGVMPRALFSREVVHPRLSRLHEVGSLHERKALMAELADAFVALPGGLGTLDEWFEAWTWAQLGIHRKPLGWLNVEGYWDSLLAFLGNAVEAGFIEAGDHARVIVETVPATLLDRLGC
jgi:uncharacterized protein (TIGR00730 family)